RLSSAITSALESTSTPSSSSSSATAALPTPATSNLYPNPIAIIPTPSPARRIRGLDYPAFDVSNEGIYNDESQPVSRFLAPLQRVFERVYGQAESENFINSLSQGNSLTNSITNASSTSSSTSLARAADGAGPVQNESRNIILTVNYVYGGTSDYNANNSGSLLLYVPSIDETNEENVSVLVRLATEIALRTIAVSLRNSAGVSKETFDSLAVKKVKDLNDNELECPICYESYVDKKTEEDKDYDKNSKKRKADHIDESDSNSSNKKVKTNEGESVPAQAEASNSETETETEADEDHTLHKETDKSNPLVYIHYPVVMKCGHIFGASCLSEWFKTNSSCPLCRLKVPNVMETSNEESRDVTITLPNLARIISTCRPYIEDFNNRIMTFSLLDQEDDSNIVTENEEVIQLPTPMMNPSNGSLLDRLTSMRRTRSESRLGGSTSASALSSITSNAAPDTGTSNTPPATNRQSLVNFIREIFSSLSRRSEDDQLNTPGVGLGTNTVPIMRSIARNNNQFPGMFPPVGVESRRTPNGVETREISMFGNQIASIRSRQGRSSPTNGSSSRTSVATSTATSTENNNAASAASASSANHNEISNINEEHDSNSSNNANSGGDINTN
ncbi:hypothetical protein C6P40_000978, partial [Pichia californica]